MEDKTVVKMVFGSHLYHLDNENSDMDYKGVVLPTAEEILLQRADFHISKSTGKDDSKNGADDIDEEYFSLARFLNLAAKGETVAIDMLHAGDDKVLESNSIWNMLVANRSMFYTKNMKAYIGYVRKQAAKYGVKGSRLAVLEDAISMAKNDNGGALCVGEIIHMLPIGEHSEIVTINNERTGEQRFYEICGRKFQDTNLIPYFIDCLEKIYDGYGARAQAAKDNNGIDWKAISHALRAGYQAMYIYKDGDFTYPLPETKFLKDVKEGKLDYLSEVQPELESLVDYVMILADDSDYPDNVDMKKVEKLILDIHTDIVKDYMYNYC